MSQLELSMTPRRGALLQGHDTTVEVLVRLIAPQPPVETLKRQPLNLAIVIDRSSSMSGRPLEEAKRCAGFIVDNLGEDDRLAIVQYDNEVEVVASSDLVRDKRQLKARIGQIRSGGMTALHSGWLSGAEQAAPFVEAGSISRVLLLTDGQANVGESRPEAIARDCAHLAESGVTTSTYGLGQNFNEELLAAMARAGLGNAYYGESAEDLMDPFREEFELLANLCARRVRVTLEPAPGVEVRDLNGYRRDAEGRLILPDIAFGGLGWMLVRLVVPAALADAGGGDLKILSVTADFETPEGQPRSCERAVLRLPRVPAAAFESVAEDGEVLERVRELRSAELQDRVREAAYAGDWERVDETLVQAHAEAGENEWLQGSLSALKTYAEDRDAARLGKEALFKASKLRSRLMPSSESASYDVTSEVVRPSYLRRKLQVGKALEADDTPDDRS